MAITFPINPLHGQQYASPGIPITWQFDSGRNAWRVLRVGTAWVDIVGKPDEFPPADHSHEIADVANLQNTLDGKQDISAKATPNGYASLDQDGRVPENQLPFGLDPGAGSDWDNITNKPAEFPPSAHTHPVAQISDSSSTGQQIVRAPTGADVLNIIGGINQDGNARVTVKKTGAIIGVRRGINLIEGTNVTMTVADDVASEEVDVTINASGGGGGASITVSEIKPAAPADSSMWLDAATGILFIYYNDGSTSQWIEAVPYLSAMPGAFTKFDFPAAPVNDQTYNPIPGATWKWSSTRGVWYSVATTSLAYTKAESDAKFVDLVGDVMTGPLGVVHPPTADAHAASKLYVDSRSLTVSDTPPVGSPDGALWWESDTGQLYVRYNDGSSTQWVVAVPQADTSTFLTKSQQTLIAAEQLQVRQNIDAAPFDALAYSGMQINGGFEISQERLTAPVTAGNYVMDGWLHNYVSGVVSAGQTASSDPPGFPFCWTSTVTTAVASLAAGDYYIVHQKIEGWRIARLSWGTANAKPITLSFWSRHHRTGLYSGIVRNAAANRCYAFTYTQAVADVSQYNTVTIPGDTTGTWATDTSIGISIIFSNGAGSTYVAPSANTWLAGNYLAAPGQVNGIAATSDVFRITGVTVLPGSQAPTAAQSPLVMRSYNDELLICQRYYYRRDYTANQWLAVFQAYTTGAASGKLCDFPVKMRAAPTGSAYGNFQVFNSAGAGFALSGGTVGTTPDFAYLAAAGGSGVTFRAGDAVLFSCNAASGHLFDARL